MTGRAGGGSSRSHGRTNGSHPHPLMSPRRARLILVLKLALSFGLLAWILSRPELAAIGPLVAAMNARWIAAGFVVAGVSLFLLAWRWHACLRAMDVVVPLWQVFQITLASSAAGYFSIGTLGADAARVFMLHRRRGIPVAAATGSLAIDHVSSLPAMIVLMMLGAGAHGILPAIEKHVVQSMVLLLLAVVAGGVILRLKWQKTHDRILGFLTDKKTRRALAAGTWRSFPLWFAHCGVFFCTAKAFGVHVPLPDFLGISAIVDAVASLPVSFAGLGVREQAFQSLLHLWHGVPRASSVALSLAGFVLFLGWAAIGALGIFAGAKRVDTTLTA